jgi:protocatechuate 3,4-dioxygenase beta subunit
MPTSSSRRSLVFAAAAAGLGGTVSQALAQARAPGVRTVLPSMTDGPFYPPRSWRAGLPAPTDWDADLTRVRRGQQWLVARGEHLALLASVIDSDGRTIDGAEVEIWQCDARASYHHPAVRSSDESQDRGFQGFGAAVSDRNGQLAFRTIRPVPYPGRTPHIHVKLRHAAFGEWTSQLFVAGEPGNDRDFLWRGLSATARSAALMHLQPVDSDDGLRWRVRQALVVPA